MQTYKKYYSKTSILGILMLLSLLLPSLANAQQVVVMPHHGADTLTVSRQNCYTIMDPGGFVASDTFHFGCLCLEDGL